MAVPDFNRANEESRAEIVELATSLAADDFEREAECGWTVALLFAHLAFWERFLEARWRHAVKTDLDVPVVFPGVLPDFLNAALEPLLGAVGGPEAVSQLSAAAESLDGLIAGLPPRSVAAVTGTGHIRLLDRSIHRREHLAQIRAAL